MQADSHKIMKLRNKLLVLLLIVSLVPLAAYFLLDITFSRIVRHRIEKTLKSTLEARAEDTMVEIINHYEEKLRMSAQAVRYGLRHYADQVQQSLWSIDVGTPPSSHRYLTWLSGEDLSKEAHKYRFVNGTGDQEHAVDFESQFLFPEQDKSQSPLSSRLSQLTDTCKDIYSINPESRLWIYTALIDGTAALYPSVGFWPYEAGYDFRLEPWFINAMRNKQLTPTPRIEPLTGKSVMTVTMPLFERDGFFAGAIAMDIDLSGLLDDQKKTLSWSSAGHDPAIWYRAQSAEFSDLENTGMPLGIMGDAEFGQADRVTLLAGDIVIIGTDGIWEARNASDEMYGKERLLNLISAHKDESAGQMASSVVASVLEFCSDSAPTDDITLVVIKCVA
ncbi:MAG: hypothetical protein A2Z25_22225 [Planctomycetes bacterium RBG_16_55_9]|nr:MAG: hypothetical protein A2Z25_22225 [Planctomycetes bacterium RBG_16_55_9]